MEEEAAREWQWLASCWHWLCCVVPGVRPLARVKLAEFWALIPIYQSALAINDLVTGTLLLTQFAHLRSRALLVFACGYFSISRAPFSRPHR